MQLKHEITFKKMTAVSASFSHRACFTTPLTGANRVRVAVQQWHKSTVEHTAQFGANRHEKHLGLSSDYMFLSKYTQVRKGQFAVPLIPRRSLSNTFLSVMLCFQSSGLSEVTIYQVLSSECVFLQLYAELTQQLPQLSFQKSMLLVKNGGGCSCSTSSGV